MRATWLSGYMAALHLNFGLDSFIPAQGALALQAASLHLRRKTCCPPRTPRPVLCRGEVWLLGAPSGHPPPSPISWLQGEGSTSGRGQAGWLLLFGAVLPASPLPPALPGGVNYPGPNGGAERQGRRTDPSWGAGGGQGQGRGAWGGAGAMRKGSKAGRVCGREGKKGQIAVVRRRKGNARNREVSARNRA